MDLLLEIVRCPNVQACLADPEKKHPCRKIVQSQGEKAAEHFQVPEPWSGHLETAPILFLSSNPSISQDEEYPRFGWGDELIGTSSTTALAGAGNHGLQRDATTFARMANHLRTGFAIGLRYASVPPSYLTRKR
jgi:hypothetical protein